MQSIMIKRIFSKSSADDTAEIGWIFMDVDHLAHARFHANLRVNGCLDAGNQANAAVNHARTPTSLVANALWQNRSVVYHASFSCIVKLDLTWFFLAIHPSEDEHFTLIDRKYILKWEELYIPSQVHSHPLIILQKLQTSCTKDPNLLIDETSSRTVMLIDHIWHVLILIGQRIVLLA